MNLYVLDTDHLTLLRRGHAEVVARVAAMAPTAIAIVIISIEEQFRGWFTQVRKARNAERLARAYEGLCYNTGPSASRGEPVRASTT